MNDVKTKKVIQYGVGRYATPAIASEGIARWKKAEGDKLVNYSLDWDEGEGIIVTYWRLAGTGE